MTKRDVIVIGASAGAVEALQELVSQFAPGIPATIFVVVHIHPRTKSFLPQILSRSGKLPAIILKTEHRLSMGAFTCRPRITIW